MLDILLITGILRSTFADRDDYLYPFTYSVPIASIYESLKHKYSIRVLTQPALSNYLEFIPESRVYAFSVSYFEMPQAKEIVQHIRGRYPEAKIVFGGQYPTTFYSDVFEYADPDFIVRGNGVAAIDNILQNNICGNIMAKGTYCDEFLSRDEISASVVSDKEAFIGIDWDAVDNNPKCFKGERWVVTNNGCIYNCSFCTNRAHSGQRIIYRNMDDIVREIGEFTAADENVIISLTEPEFNTKTPQHRKYVRDLLDGIYHKTSFSKKNSLTVFCKMADIDDEFIGILDAYKDKISYNLLAGFESFNNGILSDMGKNDSNENIQAKLMKLRDLPFINAIWGSTIIGTPTYTDNVLYENLEFIRRMFDDFKDTHVDIDITTAPLALIPGSKYYDNRSIRPDIYIQDKDIDKQIHVIEFDGRFLMNAGLQPDFFLKMCEQQKIFNTEFRKMK